LRDPIELHLWRKPKGQSIQKIPADSAGYFELPEMNIKIAVQQQRLIFADALTGEVLRDTGQFSSALENAEHNVNVAEQRATVAFDEGVEQRLQNGRLAEKQEIARNMLAAGIEPAIVAKTTGLSPDDLCLTPS